jgi:hypothetical protein
MTTRKISCFQFAKRYVSIGDICKTRYWLSFMWRPRNLGRWDLSFGPTYGGTTGGICVSTPFFVIIGHRRHPITPDPSLATGI